MKLCLPSAIFILTTSILLLSSKSHLQLSTPNVASIIALILAYKSVKGGSFIMSVRPVMLIVTNFVYTKSGELWYVNRDRGGARDG